MKFSVKQGKWGAKDIETLIVPVSEKEAFPKNAPKGAEALYKDAQKRKSFEGKKNQLLHIDLAPAGGSTLRGVLFIGLGKKDEASMREFGELVGQAIRQLQKQKFTKSGFWFREELSERFEDVGDIAETVAEYAELASYEFNTYLKIKKPQMKSMVVYVDRKEDVALAKSEVKKGASIAELINESREVSNVPSNDMRPKDLAAFAKDGAAKEAGLTAKVLSEKDMEKLGMGGILAVSRGSSEEAQFIVLEYKGGKEDEAPYVIIGKGITMDTGGMSLKPSKYMEEMKYDMCGGANTIAILRSVAALGLPINVVGLVPASENVPGQSGYKPGDVLHMMDGSTVEVLNTDAEGRLLLAGALVYARDYQPKAVIDLATLTGAVAVALHDAGAGMFTKSDDLAEQLYAAGESTGDTVWRLPLLDRHKDLLSSKVADLANISSVPYGGSMTAAHFLNHFVAGKYPWVHLDIAGVAWQSNGTKSLAPGATGAGVRCVVEWLRDEAMKEE